MRKSTYEQSQKRALERELVERQRRADMEKQIAKDRAMDTALKGESRVEDLRLIRQLAVVQKEIEQQENLARCVHYITNLKFPYFKWFHLFIVQSRWFCIKLFYIIAH